MNQEHTILQAARLSGLTTHVIRAWERRYGALAPTRTPSNRRLYSDEDIKKLILLRKAVNTGHSIGRIAALAPDDLRHLISEFPSPDIKDAETGSLTRDPFLHECLLAIDRLNAEALESSLTRAASMQGTAAMIDHVIIPLLEHVGDGWREGSVRIASEHMATVVLRNHLMRTLGSFQPAAPAPKVVVTTPSGQHHEFGALLAAVTAALQGWRVLYLGPNLPAEEIAGAAHRSEAQAVTLSIVYPPDDPRLPDELLTLRSALGKDVPILVGGRDLTAYHGALKAIGALIPVDLHSLRAELERIQSH